MSDKDKCVQCGEEGDKCIDPYIYEMEGIEEWICLCDSCHREISESI